MLWVLQRGLDWYSAQDEAGCNAGRELLAKFDRAALLDIRLQRRLTRVGSRMGFE
jgi:hypothetical protein